SENNHLGVHEQKQEGLCFIGLPVLAGRLGGSAMIRVAELMEREGGEIRLTQQQNLLLANVPRERVNLVLQGAEAVGLAADGVLRGTSVACTGQPFCNFAVTNTKT